MSTLNLSSCVVDLARLTVTGPRGERRLTTREAELLRYLVANPSRSVAREELLHEVWGYSDHVVSRAADNAVRRLREKIEEDPANPAHIVTVFGTGYRFEPTIASAAAAVPTPTETVDPALVTLGDKRIDLRRQCVSLPGESRTLTGLECQVLAYLIAHANRSVSREELLRKVWGRSGRSGSRAVDSLVGRLRAKVEDDPSEPVHLLTVRGSGYRFAFGDTRVAPTGQVALASAALYDEAALWAADPELATEVVGALGELFDTLADRRGGYVARQDGGAFRLAFASVDPCIRFCLEAQERLSDLSWRGARSEPDDGAPHRPGVAMAVHVGTPIPVPDPDGRVAYRGPDADRAEAVLAAAAPGQVLVTGVAWSKTSKATRRLARCVPLDRADAGIDGRVVCLVSSSRGERSFSALTTTARHGLPPSGAFFGREREVVQVGDLVRGGGLVTLVGPPGIGKTRLAARIAADESLVWPGGVWWVDLAPTRTRPEVVRAVAARLEVPLDDSDDPARTLGRALASRGQVLLVLDNYEQVADAARDVADALAQAAPSASVLVTSRVRLGVDGESLFQVVPMEPEAAVRLFEDRAARTRAGFDSGEDPAAVADLVERLDRLPLAVELAAARVGLLSPRQILERLEGRPVLLADRYRARYATMDDAIAWSWDLLAPWERAAMAQLSLFRGGFTLDAAEALVDLAAWPDAPEVVDVIQSLRDHSLLRSWADPEHTGRVRLGAYESIRAYAAARRRDDAAGDRRATRKFVAWHARYGTEEFQASLEDHGGVARLHQLASEIDNLVTATELGIAADAAVDAARCALAALRVYDLRPPFANGVEIGERALALPGLPSSLRAWLGTFVARCLRACDRNEAAGARARDAVAEARACGEPALEARAGSILAEVHKDRFDLATAQAEFERVAALAAEAGRRDLYCYALAKLHRSRPGGLAEAERWFAETVREAEIRGNAVLAALARSNLGRVANMRGRLAESVTLCDEAIAGLDALGDRQWALATAQFKASVLVELGRLDESVALRRELLEATRAGGRTTEEAQALLEIAHAQRLAGRVEEAWRAVRQATRLMPTVDDVHLRGYHEIRLGEVYLDRGDLPSARHHVERGVQQWCQGENPGVQGYALAILAGVLLRQEDLDAALEVATDGVERLRGTGLRFDQGYALARLGQVHAARDELEPAAEALAEAESLLAATGAGPNSELGQAIEALRRDLG